MSSQGRAISRLERPAASPDAALASLPAAEPPRPDDRATPLERDWIAAARAMLIEGGIAAVQINPLAARLGVTRGGYYWRFRDRAELLGHLMADWADSNVRATLRVLGRKGAPAERYLRLVRLWLDERAFDPKLDAAVRQWGRIDPAVAQRVLAADETIIAAMADLFACAGQPSDEAMVRARIVYFHQVGYWTLGMRETRERRRELMPVYTRLLTGFDA